MVWYTLTWEHCDEGRIVEHYGTQREVEKRIVAVKHLSTHRCTYGITVNTINRKSDLLKWLNSRFNRDNG